MFHAVAKTLNLRKLKGSAKAEFATEKFKYITGLDGGVCFVHLRAGTDFDHCVVIDADQKHIIDSEE